MLSSSVSPDQTGSNSRVSQIPQLDNTPVWAPIIGTLFSSRRIIRSSSWQRHKLVLAISRPPGGVRTGSGGASPWATTIPGWLQGTQGLGYCYTHPGGQATGIGYPTLHTGISVESLLLWDVWPTLRNWCPSYPSIHSPPERQGSSFAK